MIEILQTRINNTPQLNHLHSEIQTDNVWSAYLYPDPIIWKWPYRNTSVTLSHLC